MTTYTTRFKLPIIETTDILSLESFNQPNQIIDQVCLGFKDFSSKTVSFDSTGKGSVSLANVPSSIHFLQIFPEDPSNETNWVNIARASIRAYQEGTNLILQCQGVIPTSVTIHIVGYY